jgi:hypothetical protein
MTRIFVQFYEKVGLFLNDSKSDPATSAQKLQKKKSNESQKNCLTFWFSGSGKPSAGTGY